MEGELTLCLFGMPQVEPPCLGAVYLQIPIDGDKKEGLQHQIDPCLQLILFDRFERIQQAMVKLVFPLDLEAPGP